MANLKENRNRITSVSSTMQITSAKMVSAEAKESTRCDYSNAPLCRKINGILQNLLLLLGDGEFTTQRNKSISCLHLIDIVGL
jgi:F-type H+-transporting ATPase subunit gamma